MLLWSKIASQKELVLDWSAMATAMSDSRCQLHKILCHGLHWFCRGSTWNRVRIACRDLQRSWAGQPGWLSWSHPQVAMALNPKAQSSIRTRHAMTRPAWQSSHQITIGCEAQPGEPRMEWGRSHGLFQRSGWRCEAFYRDGYFEALSNG